MKKKLWIIWATSLAAVAIVAGIIVFVVLQNNKNDIKPDNPTHTHEYTETVEPPTCTTGGYTLHKCACGEEYKDNETAALGHDYVAEITAPSCTEQGYTTYTCTRCDNNYKDNYTAKIPHDYEWTTTKEATETEDGVKTGVCKVCGDTVTKTIPSLSHVHNYVETVIAPDCTNGGCTLHKCDCGEEYKDNETPALGHNYGEWVITTPPSCTTAGIETRACSRDETHIETRIIPMTGHNYAITANIAATCTENGYIKYVCTLCGDEKIQIILAEGHYFGDDNVCDKCGYTLSIIHEHTYNRTVVAPTCTTMGYTDYVCDCGANLRADYIEPLGHRYDNGVVIKNKTCTENGIIKYTCIRCDVSYTEPIPAGHTWSETITENATCTASGRVYKVCLVCGEEETETIPAHHTWDSGTVITPATCTESGSIKHTCLVCGATEIREIKPLGHRYVNGVCTRCGEKFIDNVSPEPNHPLYGMYFLVDDIRSDYRPELINEYGVLLYVNEGAVLDKVAVYLTQDNTMWRRCIACTGSNIEFAVYVPYLSYGENILYTGLNSSSINTFALSKGSDGIWRYSEYATIGVNLADYQGNLLLSLYDIGQAGAKTRVFDDLSKMKAWLKGENPDTVHTHTVVIDEGIEPTCTQNGLSAGSHCSVCGEVIVARELIPATGVHNYVNGTCTVCGAEEPTVNPPQSDVYTVDGDYIYFGVYPQSDVTAAKGNELSSYVQTKPSNGNNNGWTSYNYYINSSNTTDFMWYKDVDADNNGTKDYRAVYFTSYRPCWTGSSSSTDNINQYDNGYYTSNVYWFKYEPIKWRILSQANGKATILAELILDSQDYNYTYNSRTIDNKTVYANNYAYSSIRAWLNDNFYNTAFNEYEKAIINTVEVDNSARSTNPDNNATYWNSGTNNYACENTYDKVWLLSGQEVTKAAYGFDEDPNAYGVDSTRIRKTSAYAKCQGAYTYSGGNYDGNSIWWLRSPYYYNGNSRSVNDDCNVDCSYRVNCTTHGVVPALQITLTGHTPAQAVQENYTAATCVHSGSYDSVIYCSACGVEISRETTVIPATGVHNYVNGTCTVCGAEEPTVTPPQSDVYTVDGDYIYFGVYPQSDVTAAKGNELSSYVQTKPSNGNNNGWISYNYYISNSNTTDFMWYKDVDVDNNGTKDYRAVYFTSYRPYLMDSSSSTGNSNQDDNGYYISNVYWFKYEPIKWRILSQANGKAIILAELILDSQDYNYTSYGNNYAYSSIRAWLNDNFYNTAFNEYEKALINTVEVDNGARSTNPDNNATYWNSGANTYACENTYDKVWLLSGQEVTKAAYGFDEDPNAYGVDSTRIRKTSAYAKCQGAYTYSGGNYDGNGSWWLRSPNYDYNNLARCVDYNGYANDRSRVYKSELGVVPALQITLAEDEIAGTYEVYSLAIDSETVFYAGQEYEGEVLNAEDLTFTVDIDGTCRFVHMGDLSFAGTWEKVANGGYRCMVSRVEAEDWVITDNFTLDQGKITFGEYFADYVFMKKN